MNYTVPNIGDQMGDSVPEASNREHRMPENDSTPIPALATRNGAPAVIDAIEDIIGNIADSLAQKQELTIELRTKRSPDTSGTPESGQRVAVNTIRFPGRNEREAWKFSVLLRILDLIHQALVENFVVSKRNLYYKDPSLFKSHQVIDRYIDSLAFTLGVQRADLNVTAAAKGLVIGGFRLITKDGNVVQHDHDSEATLIGDIQNAEYADIEGAAWILVIEKESSFRTLASSKFHENPQAGKGIILTAKGYPDLATRKLLRLLATSAASSCPPPRVFALADFDPDGITIMSNYKHGSWSLSHENAALVVPSIEWLGLRSDALLGRDVDDRNQGLLRLSNRDRKKAMKMLEKPPMSENGTEPVWRRELQVMLMLGVKAEMEIMSKPVGGLEGWVEKRLVEELHDNEEVMES